LSLIRKPELFEAWHNPKGAILIVCWTDNWPERPKNLQVIEAEQGAKGM